MERVERAKQNKTKRNKTKLNETKQYENRSAQAMAAKKVKRTEKEVSERSERALIKTSIRTTTKLTHSILSLGAAGEGKENINTVRLHPQQALFSRPRLPAGQERGTQEIFGRSRFEEGE